MSMLCNRCELLFGDCRPLLGQTPCDLMAQPALGLPITNGAPRLSAAIAVDHRAEDGDGFRAEPFLAFDFYPKEHS